MRKLLLFSLFVIIVLLLTNLKQTQVLTITSNETNKILWSRSVTEGDLFTIRFIHSVEKTEVDEIIRIGKDDLVIDSTIFESFGAGLPFDVQQDQTMRTENGKVIIENIDRHVPSIDVFIGQVIANHTLLFKGKMIPLKDLSKPGTSLRFSVTRENQIMAFFKEVIT
ncbi:DUF1850 domain-containing protein [Jeotgalibacillus soli]|uniref:DUF1850 domain-containing protein n=1 Tax=Jeotgalibacillus soli TaxID=889306 RepID=A0A0C2VYA2_9BACL|nr:DUF1850 domain-containing protein [Jeotgalibacillus soli]KIL49396.1 hypothetical protein KP78_08640 [Jeotgalibacillus soli]